jgi:hypothetical protein
VREPIRESVVLDTTGLRGFARQAADQVSMFASCRFANFLKQRICKSMIRRVLIREAAQASEREKVLDSEATGQVSVSMEDVVMG